MKTALKCLLLLTVLFCGTPDARAGFWVKKHATTEVAAITGKSVVVTGNTAAGSAAHKGIIGRIHRAVMPFSLPNGYSRPNGWFGPVALACGVLGLLIPGMNFAAILFGVLGMGRRSTMKGMAVAGFALGLIELAIFLIAQTVFISLILL